jgi:hypothetical protein
MMSESNIDKETEIPADTSTGGRVGLSSDAMFPPWKLRTYRSGILRETRIDDSEGNILARMCGSDEQGRLMAAAPDMLEFINDLERCTLLPSQRMHIKEILLKINEGNVNADTRL